MACSCSKNNRKSGGYGCCRAVRNTRWPSCGYNPCANASGPCGNGGPSCGCHTNHCGNHGTCTNPCGSCGNTGSCGGSSCIHPRTACDGSCTIPCGNTGSCGGSSCIQPRTACDGSCTNSCSPCGSCSTCGNHGACTPPCGSCGGNSCIQPRTACGGGCSSPGSGLCGDCHPFYCGPCGPVDPVCDCTAHCPPGSVPEPYGYFTQTGTLEIGAGEAIPFCGAGYASGVNLCGGEITLEKNGVYMVSLSLSIPENTTLDTVFSIRLNGETVVGGEVRIDKPNASRPLNVLRQVVVSACQGAVLQVTSSEPVNLSAGDCGLIASLTVTKIS